MSKTTLMIRRAGRWGIPAASRRLPGQRPVLWMFATLLLLAGNATAQEPPPDSEGVPAARVLDPLLTPRDTVVAFPGRQYRAGTFHRLILGDLNRHLWSRPFRVGVLDLSRVGGGLQVDEMGGGMQTRSLHFVGNDGLEYTFRSIEKDASGALPPALARTFVGDIAQDQMAAQFPLGAMIVAELLRSSDVLVATPRPAIMPDDPRLGEHREAMAGRIGWIEMRPNEREGDRPGFVGSDKIVGTDELYDKLEEGARNFVDPMRFLRARLIDVLVGDWDRHADQWRWASFETEAGEEWRPIPRDRDYAFGRMDGLVPWIARNYWPPYVGFGPDFPHPQRYSWHGRDLDRRILSALELDAFLSLADSVQAQMSDSVIDRALSILPESYQADEVPRLRRSLQSRRDQLGEYAERFYLHLAGWTDLHGFEGQDSVVIEMAPGEARVRLTSHGEDGTSRTVDRRFLKDHTREIRIYLDDGDDAVEVVGEGDPGMDIRIIGGSGQDHVVNRTTSAKVHFYDVGDESSLTGPGQRDKRPYEAPEDEAALDLEWEFRDWGSAWVTRPAASFDSDLGVYFGARMDRYGFGFRAPPFKTRWRAEALYSPPDQWLLSLGARRTLNHRGLALDVGVDRASHRYVYFFGIGNETQPDVLADAFRTTRSSTSLHASVVQEFSEGLELSIGPTWTRRGQEGGNFRFTDLAYGAGTFQDLSVGAELNWQWNPDHSEGDEHEEDEERQDDDASAPILADASLSAGFFPAALDVQESFGRLAADLSVANVSVGLPGPLFDFVLGAGHILGDGAPYPELAYVGGAGEPQGLRGKPLRGPELPLWQRDPSPTPRLGQAHHPVPPGPGRVHGGRTRLR